MNSDNILSVTFIIAMIFLGVYFSATETAFSALNRIRIKSMAEAGSKRAALVLRLHDDFDKVLSTLLVLNNLATLVAAAISTLLFVRYLGDIGATISTITLTVVIVFFGDITPKSLAKESPEKFALACAPLLYFFVKLVSPVNWIFAKWKSLLDRLFKTSSDDRMTEEELYSIVEEAQNDGVINEDGKQLLEKAIEFNDRRAGDILTPRIDLAAIPEDSSEEEITKVFMETGYSRLPVYRDSIDNVVGVVHMRDFFRHIREKSASLESIFSLPLFVAPSTRINDLFKLLQTQTSHLAVVTDEYGGTAGIVTMEDILEELVGDIWDESDEIIVEFSSLGDNRHKVICSAYLKDMFNYFGLGEDSEAESVSVSGWIMDKLGKVPEEGDVFSFENLTVAVHKTEHRRVLECIVTVEADPQKEESQDESA